MNVMARKKNPQTVGKGTEKYRKPRRMAGIPERIAKAVDILVAQNESDFTEEIRKLVIEGLERRNLWPDPPKKP